VRCPRRRPLSVFEGAYGLRTSPTRQSARSARLSATTSVRLVIARVAWRLRDHHRTWWWERSPSPRRKPCLRGDGAVGCPRFHLGAGRCQSFREQRTEVPL